MTRPTRVDFPYGTDVADFVPGRFKRFGVGVDCHRKMLWCCVLRPDYPRGTMLRWVVRFPTTPAGLAEFRTWVEDKVPPPCREVLVESTGTYHFPVLLALPGWTHIVINPRLAGGAKRKSDRWDAQQLAYHNLCGSFRAYVPPTEQEMILRVLLRRRLKLKAERIRLSNGIMTRLCMFGINPLVKLTSRHGAEVIEAILDMGSLVHWAETEEEADAFQRLQPLVERLPEPVNWCLRRMLVRFHALAKEVSDHELLIESLLPPRAGLLTGVAGVGPVARWTFVAEIGVEPSRRFTNVRQAVAYAGLDPSKRISADKVTSHMPTAGSVFLRRAFTHAAMAALNHVDKPLGAYGRQVIGRTGKYRAGVFAVARKLFKECFHVLVKAEGGEPERAGGGGSGRYPGGAGGGVNGQPTGSRRPRPASRTSAR